MLRAFVYFKIVMLFTDYLKHLLIVSAIALIAPLIFIFPMFFCTSFGLSNIFAVIATIYLGGCGLYAITRAGTFDVFRYQFINWMSSFRKEGNLRYKDAYTYQEKMRESREKTRKFWIPFVVIGLISAILSLVFAYFPVV